MEVQSTVDFQEVMGVFRRDNVDTPERNDWPSGALEIANNQFRTWARVVLYPHELGSIMLPQHDHGVHLIPPAGASVLESLKNLDAVDRSSECYRRIQQFVNSRDSAIFLSVAPIDDPRFSDYAGLVQRGYKGLTHLDGLHRLIAWTIEGNRNVLAYVAGL